MTDVDEAIDKNDFYSLLEIFTRLSKASDQLLKHYCIQSRKKLNFCLNEWIEKSTTNSRLLFISIGDESGTQYINEIVKYLNLFDKIKILHEFIDLKETENCRETINKHLKEAFYDHFSSVETSIKNFNFTVANSAIKTLKQKCELQINIVQKIFGIDLKKLILS